MSDNVNNVENIDFQNYFSNELSLIDSELKEIDNLYCEIKGHYDLLRDSQSRGTLGFIEKQTSNLVSLKSAKLSMIKERINIKKQQVELGIKTKPKDDDKADNNIELIMQLARHLNSDENQSSIQETEEDIDIYSDNFEDDLDRRIAELEENNEIEYSDNELETLGELQGETPKPNNNYKIVVLRNGKKWNFGAVDIDNNIVEGVDLPNKKDYKMKLVRDNGEIIAVDQNDKIYEVLDIG